MNNFLLLLNQINPLAIAGLALIIIYTLIQNRRSISSLRDNHLHDLKIIIQSHEEREDERMQELAHSLVRLESMLRESVQEDQRNRTDIKETLSHIKARLNGPASSYRRR